MKKSSLLSVFVPALFALLVSTGCQVFNPQANPGESILRRGIPPGAEMVGSGIGRFTHEFEQPGRAYLYDPQRDVVVGRYQVRPGQRLAVDVRAGQVTLDGTPIRSERMRQGDTYQIYLLPMDQAGDVQFQENTPPAQDDEFQPQGGAQFREGEIPGLGAVDPLR